MEEPPEAPEVDGEAAGLLPRRWRVGTAGGSSSTGGGTTTMLLTTAPGPLHPHPDPPPQAGTRSPSPVDGARRGGATDEVQDVFGEAAGSMAGVTPPAPATVAVDGQSRPRQPSVAVALELEGVLGGTKARRLREEPPTVGHHHPATHQSEADADGHPREERAGQRADAGAAADLASPGSGRRRPFPKALGPSAAAAAAAVALDGSGGGGGGDGASRRVTTTTTGSTFYRPPTNKLYRRLEGYLWKKGQGLMSGWKKRWFALKDNRLYYSEHRDSTEVINYILLASDTKLCAAPDQKHQFAFQLSVSYTPRVFVLAATDARDLERWMAGLREVIKLLVDRYKEQKEFIRQHLLLYHHEESAAEGSTPSEVTKPSFLGPSSTRELVDVQVGRVRLAERAHNVCLVISLGKQTFRTWSYRQKDDTWDGVGCTFTNEGSGDGSLRGQIKFALYQDSSFQPQSLLGERFIDISELESGEPVSHLLTFDMPSHVPTDRNRWTPLSSRTISAELPKCRYDDEEQPIRKDVLKASKGLRRAESERRRSQSGALKMRGISDPCIDIPSEKRRTTQYSSDRSENRLRKQAFAVLDFEASAELALSRTVQSAEWKEKESEPEQERQVAEELSINEKEGEKVEDKEDRAREPKRLSHRTRNDEISRSSGGLVRVGLTSSTTFISIKVQRSLNSFDRNGLLFDRGIASTSIPLRVDTGDIILFNNTHLLSYGTKIFTWSQWDHVAMVVRWWNNELKLLEATLEDGVEVYNFDDRLEFLRTVSKVAVRRLNVQRTPEMMDSIYRFIDEVHGRPFQKNRFSIILAAGGLNNEEDLSSLFCSELATEGYKRMGLVRDNAKKSNNYLPRSWAGKTNSKLPLKPGTDLERKFVFPRISTANT